MDRYRASRSPSSGKHSSRPTARWRVRSARTMGSSKTVDPSMSAPRRTRSDQYSPSRALTGADELKSTGVSWP